MITSASNQFILQAKKLLQKKYRDQYGMYLAEGAKLLREALDRAAKILYIVVDDSQKEKFSTMLSGLNIPTYYVEPNVFASLTDAVTPQGILTVLSKPQNLLINPKSKALVLEQLQDPTNVGAILRTAAAAGYDYVYLADCADAFSPKCMRAGMSSQFCLNIISGNINDIICAVKQTCTLLCADMDGKSVFDTTVPKMHALLLGNEGNGVSSFAKSTCDATVCIPMNNNMESLNVAVSAGVLMYFLNNNTK